jgi:ABC-type uncharacterized transport system permease subunit
MAGPLILNALALAALIGAAIVPLRANAGRDAAFWAAAGLAALVPGLWAGRLLLGGWHTQFGTLLWVIAAASAALFLGLAALSRQGWRLGPLLLPYLACLGVIASVVRGEPRPMTGGAPALWVDLHILVAVSIFALLTLAAVASAAVFLQERALKTKRPNALTALLPSVADSERLSGRLLAASEVVLGAGLATGMAIQYFETGALLRLDHKTLLSLAAFALIGALLLGHRVCGVRGRLAARVVLIAYLLVMLASPGVKFVTQVIL